MITHNQSVHTNDADADTLRRVWQCLGGSGTLLNELLDMLVAPHDIPLFLCTASARVPHVHPACPRPAPVSGSGCGLTRRAAQVSAACETIERYSARRCCLDEAVRATYRALGSQAVDPQQFALYADEQYAAPSFHFQRVRETSVLAWVKGWSWTQQRSRYLPTCFVYLEPCAGAERCVFHGVSTGLACGATAEQARLAGLCEVIERDAIMIAWLNGLELPRVQPPADGAGLAALYHKIAAVRLQATVLDATTDIGLPVRIALVEDQGGAPEACAVGMAAHPDPLQAHGKALMEACHTMNWLHQLQRKYPRLEAPVAEVPLRTFRDHVRFYGDIRATPALGIWRCGPWRHEERHGSYGDATPCQQFNRLVSRLAELGYEVLTIDVTPPDIAEAGFCVMRSVVPGLQPLTPGRAVCLGGARLRTVPHALGHRARYRPNQWNPAPHPFP